MSRPQTRSRGGNALVVLCALVLLGAAGTASAQLLSSNDLLSASGEAVIGPVLSDTLEAASSDEPVEAVLTFNEPPSALVIDLVRATGVDVVRFEVLPMVGVRGTAGQLRALMDLPDLRSVYANRRLEYSLDESAPLIGAPRVWRELGITGRGVGVAVLDSGVDATHPDLSLGDEVVQNVKIVSALFAGDPLYVEGVSNTDTSSGHGTHVASIAGGSGEALGGRYRGIAPGADLVGVGAGETLFVLHALQGLDWILDNRKRYGIRVVNNSWGAQGAFSPDDPVNVASRAAHDAGIAVVFAAGNEGPESGTLNAYCAPWVICVGAVHKDGETLADFSSRGVPAGRRPTLTAPGAAIAAARATTGVVMNAFFAVDVVALGDDAAFYTVADGTSMAAPHVSGTVALMLEANPGLGPGQIRTLLEETATPMLAYEPHEVGAGLVDAAAAVEAAREAAAR